jgi:hypothetical protein
MKTIQAQRSWASSVATATATNVPTTPEAPLWRAPGEPITRLDNSITGAREWQTSMYTFNKQTRKTIPAVTNNVEKLLRDYLTMKSINNEGKDVRNIRSAIAARRKSAEKLYISKPRVKDYGDRVEVKAFIWDGKAAARDMEDLRNARFGRKGTATRGSRDADFVTDENRQKGLQSLLARLYSKQVDLKLIEIKRPHQDADILANFIAQKLRDRRNTPRRVIRDATWKVALPSPQTVAKINNARLIRVPNKFEWQDFTIGNAAQTNATSIVEDLSLSQVSSIAVEAAGRLTKRLTASQSAKKMARRGTATKGPAYMLRGFRKAHTHYALGVGKRRVGQFGIKVHVGHT